MRLIDVAQVCHEANRALQRINGEVVNFPWESTSDALRDSGVDGVQAVLRGDTPEQLHDSWSRGKIADGWVYGEVKDFARKTHPQLVAYDKLPPEQRLKDYVFAGIVRAVVEAGL